MSESWTKNVNNLFIIGAVRSGTTWLQSILASHPLIYSGVETFFFSATSSLFREMKAIREINVGLSAYLDYSDFTDLIEYFFWNVASNLPKPQNQPKYFLEKTPSHSLFVQDILDVFPNAKFIHMIRDCRMVVNSVFKTSDTWGGSWATKDLDREVLKWKRYVLAGIETKNLVQNRDQYLEVRYEDLREDTHKSIESILKWLQMEFDELMLDEIIRSNTKESMIKTSNLFSSVAFPNSSNFNNKNFPKEFIQRGNYKSKNYGLSKYQKLRVDYLVGDLLTNLGYSDVKTKFNFLERIIVYKKVARIFKLL